MGTLVDRITDLTNLFNNTTSVYKINLTDNSKKIEKSKKIKKCNFNGCKEIMDDYLPLRRQVVPTRPLEDDYLLPAFAGSEAT